MAYATITDVGNRMPQFALSANSKPTEASGQVFLDDTHAHLDGCLSNIGYVVPITGPNSLAQVREIVCQGTIAKILYARAAAVGTDASVASAERAQKTYEALIAALADPNNPAELIDAERTDDAIDKTQQFLDGLTDLEARITMETKF